MESINLSKLVFSPHFLDTLEEEHIHYDAIITDNKELSKEGEVKLIDNYLETYFSKLNKGGKYLIILDKLGIKDILPYIKDLKLVSLVSANSAMGSFGKKYQAEIDYLSTEGINNYNICFPWDFENFLELLKKDENAIFPLPAQEIADNIYDSPSEEEEGIQFIDKSLIDNHEILSLFSPEKPDLLVIGFGNHFEELVKLSQFLAMDKARISLAIVNNWNYLFSEDFKEYYKNAKKIAIILGCKTGKAIENKLSKLGKSIVFLTPEFDKLTSIFPEYYFEQTGFNAISLYEKCLNLV